jgi:alpha-L-fucosidase
MVSRKAGSYFRLAGVSSVVAVIFLLSIITVSAQTKTLYQAQSDCVNWRFGMYIHFNMNTFYPGWGEARTDPKTFAPTNVDCGQWARAAVSAKMKFGALTTKHHDGFCLWPSSQTPPRGAGRYTVMESAYPHDIVKMYVDSFRVYGLQPGLYYSMWDAACGIPGCYADPATVRAEWSADSAYVMGQLTELLTNYGQIPLLIFDGYSWDMGHWAFPYQYVRALVKRLQPNCIITDHNGLIYEAWEQDIADFEEPLGITCPSGNTYASQQENTISGDWFWNSTAADINQLKTVSFITQHLTTLEPRWCNFLLNCPPNKTGIFDAAIVTRLGQVGPAWSPNTSRAALSSQPAIIERPITPVSATATSNSSTAVNAIDNTNDFSGGHAQSLWTSSGSLPQSVTLDLGKVYDTIDMLMYQPRRESSTTGNITSYRIYVSTNGTTFTQVASGTWAADVMVKRAQFPRQSARYVRLEAVVVNGGAAAVVNTIAVGANLMYWQTVGVSEQTKKHISQPPCMSIKTAMGRLTLDPAFAGKTNTVAVYSLGGRLIDRKNTKSITVDLRKDFCVPDGVYVVKISVTH